VEKNKGLWLIAIYFFLALYLLPMFSANSSANELARWATAVSLVENSSFDISRTKKIIGENIDAVNSGEKVYANQPPGAALIAAPVYALTRIFLGAPDETNFRTNWFVMRFCLSTLPLLLLALWLYQRDSDEISLAALLFATPLFVYSLLFYAHVLVAVLLYLVFRLLYDTERIFLRNCFAAGLIAGVAVACELTAVIPIVVFGVGLFFARRSGYGRWQNAFFFAVGILPFVILLLIYNHAIFGAAFSFPYFFETFPETENSAGQSHGIGLPTVYNAYLLLFSPSRGLFFYAPILFLSFAAFFSSRERASLRHRVKIAAVLISILAVCGHGAAHGGWAFGARYLIFILPLLLDSFFDGEVYEFSNLWQGFLFTISFLFCTIPALTFPLAPPEFEYPHNNFWWKLLFDENVFAPNLTNLFGFSASLWTTLPAAVLLFAALYLVWRYSRRPSRFFIGAIAAFVIVSVYFFLPNLDGEQSRQRRAVIIQQNLK
jgi:hypothetical protein